MTNLCPEKFRRTPAGLLLLVLALSCAHKVDPRGPEGIRSSNAQADSAFSSARQRFQAGDWKRARLDMERFAALYPDDPLAPFAQVYAGRAAREMGDLVGAARILEAIARGNEEQPATVPARYYLGLVEAERGDCGRATALLGPLEPSISPDEEALGLLASLARCNGEKSRPLDALRYWGRYHNHRATKEYEKAYARQKARELAATLSDADSFAAYGNFESDSLGRAVLGAKALAVGRRKLDDGRYRDLEAEVARLRARYSDETSNQEAAEATSAVPRTLGLLVAMSGSTAAASTEVLRGAVMAVGGFSSGQGGAGAGPTAKQAGIRLIVQNTGGDKNRAADAVQALEAEGAMAIVGPVDRAEAEAAAARAEALHLPLVDLTLWPAPRPGPYVMHGMHTAPARLEKLLAVAKARGAKRLAVLYPQSAYGKRMRERLQPLVEAAGFTLAIEVPYENRATSFAGPLRTLAAASFDALFVPDGASRLELIGPALAAADLWSSPSLGTVPKQGRAILLLSTAENLSSRILRESRYLQGALLSPGYYSEPGPFVDGYRAEHGEDPSIFAAVSYDIVRLARHVLESGLSDRERMASALVRTTGVWGVQGEVRLSESGGTRADEPPVFTINGQTIERMQSSRNRLF